MAPPLRTSCLGALLNKRVCVCGRLPRDLIAGELATNAVLVPAKVVAENA